MKKNIGDLLVDLWKNNQRRPARLFFWQKGKCITINKAPASRDDIKKMLKTGNTLSITEDADSRGPQRTDLKLTLAERKGISS